MHKRYINEALIMNDHLPIIYGPKIRKIYNLSYFDNL